MSRIRIDAVWFQAFSDDHLPAHVHGFYGEVQVIADLLETGTAVLSARKRNIQPANAKASDVRKILELAAENYATLKALWEKQHGAGKVQVADDGQ